MALLVNIQKIENGFEGVLSANDIIVKVDHIYGNKNNISFSIVLYKDNIAFDTKSYSFTPIIDGDNFIKQAYEYLKTLEEFKDSKDV